MHRTANSRSSRAWAIAVGVVLAGGCSGGTAEVNKHPTPELVKGSVPPDSKEERREIIANPPPEGRDRPIRAPSDSGARAPGGMLTDTAGKPFSLDDAYADHIAIIVFYRGHWCVQCRQQLAELESSATELLREGAHVYAISADATPQLVETRDKLKLSYPLLSDPQGQVMRSWGVFDSELEISKPATFVVAKGGEVTYRYIGADPDDRPRAYELIKIARDAAR